MLSVKSSTEGLCTGCALRSGFQELQLTEEQPVALCRAPHPPLCPRTFREQLFRSALLCKGMQPAPQKRLLFVCLHSTDGSLVTKPSLATNCPSLASSLGSPTAGAWGQQGALLHHISSRHHKLLLHISQRKTHFSPERLDPNTLLIPADTTCTHFQSLQLPSHPFLFLSPR